MRTLDGGQGEGGGQVLRTALGCSLVTGEPFHIHRIRAGRAKPGLMRQHLTAVNAAVQLSGGRVEGACVGSTELTFHPGTVNPDKYHFAIGSAGSTTLVVQALLPALLLASGPSELTFEGGTHNPLSPPYPFLAEAFFRVVRSLGPAVESTLERVGFLPAGGGRFRMRINPAPLGALCLLERGEVVQRKATALVAQLPRSVADRELAIVRDRLGWGPTDCHVDDCVGSTGPGNALVLKVVSEHVTEVVVALGAPSISAARVANEAVDAMEAYFDSRVPVGAFLADQLLMLLALARKGQFRTGPLSLHATTQVSLLHDLLGVTFQVREADATSVTVEVQSAA